MLSCGTGGFISVYRGSNGVLDIVGSFRPGADVHREEGDKVPSGGLRGLAILEARGDTEIASVGQDGRLTVSRVNGETVYEVLEADSFAIAGVEWRSINEIVRFLAFY